MRNWHALLLGAVLAGAILSPAVAESFKAVTLATDATDSGLINPWGLAASATGPFWLGVNGSGTSEIYNGAGTKMPLVVSIPGDGSVTGVEFNGGSGFNGDRFLFASEDGTVSGWRPALATNAEVLELASSDVYKGLTLGTTGGFDYLYLANFSSGTIDYLKGNAAAPDLGGGFTDPNLPAGYAPFNIRNLGGSLYVTFAVQDPSKKDDVAGAGNGIIDRFDLNGNLLGRLVTGGALDSPWGLALAPAGFGSLDGALLVGNFGDGLIHAYDPLSGLLLQALVDASGNPIVIDGLWALQAGNGGSGGNPDMVYFTAGPNGENGGRFGRIAIVPEPATLGLVSAGLLALALRYRRGSQPRRAA